IWRPSPRAWKRVQQSASLAGDSCPDSTTRTDSRVSSSAVAARALVLLPSDDQHRADGLSLCAAAGDEICGDAALDAPVRLPALDTPFEARRHGVGSC